MPRGKSDQNAEILEYALRHLEQERDELQEKINLIRRQLGLKGGASAPAVSAPAASPAASAPATGRAKRVLSPAARKRIATAQRKRWAEHRKNQKATKKVA